jgi:thioredoxin 1
MPLEALTMKLHQHDPMNTTRTGDEMATVELTADAFEETVTSSGITLVDFWADWCGPCKSFSPIYDAASEKNPDIRFGKVDTEAEQALSAAAGITSIPTLMAFRDGILVFSQPGALPAPALDQVIAAVKGLDMDEVRAQISAQDESQPGVERA